MSNNDILVTGTRTTVTTTSITTTIITTVVIICCRSNGSVNIINVFHIDGCARRFNARV